MKQQSEMSKPTDRIHPDFDNEDYIGRLMVDRTQDHESKKAAFESVCKGMSLEELSNKIDELEEVHKYVGDSLTTQLMSRADDKIVNDTLDETAYTQGLIKDLIGIAKNQHTQQLGEI